MRETLEAFERVPWAQAADSSVLWLSPAVTPCEQRCWGRQADMSRIVARAQVRSCQVFRAGLALKTVNDGKVSRIFPKS